MSMRIPPSPPLPIPVPTSRSAASDGGIPRFGNLVREFEGGPPGATDFLGQRAAGGGANLFNADGFFTKLEQHLAEGPVEQSAFAEVPHPLPPGGPAEDGQPRPETIPGEPTADHMAAVLKKAPRHVPELPPQAAGRDHGKQPAASPAEPRAVPGESPQIGEEGPAKPTRAHNPPVRLDLGSTPFRAFIDGDSVRIIGPARYLSEAEEEALATAVAELMTTHDLGVDDLWFNGRRMMPGQPGVG
ncbi:hypothetical protein [Sphingomonas sp.]|uniref:hypothetical protein n=1 Tax=Sphingomonas sp. TaxID=28214 RepID=UPI0025F193DB|nr:hypothetical protein [Sphingomonas sp.]